MPAGSIVSVPIMRGSWQGEEMKMAQVVFRALATVLGATVTLFVALQLSAETDRTDEFPTFWGRTTIVLALGVLTAIAWRLTPSPKSTYLKLSVNTAIAIMVIVFLFSFMEWASWYK